MAAHAAILDALNETVLVDGQASGLDRLPLLPDDYEIVRELGRGGMGAVYLARQRSLGRLLAVKVPGRERAFGPVLRRFEEEARHLARLRHPNIVSVHEVGRAEGQPYFTMDYVRRRAAYRSAGARNDQPFGSFGHPEADCRGGPPCT